MMRVVSAAMVTLCLMPASHAEMSAVVQCRIGSYAEQMPDYVCIAFRRGAAKLTTDPNSMYACAKEAELSITNPSTNPTVISATCNTIWQARMEDRVEEAVRRGGR